MKLRTKTLLFSVILYVPLSLLTYIGLRALLVKDYERLEEEQMKDNVGRVVNAVRNDMAQMDGTLHDWSAWDDMADYMVSRSEVFAEGNLFAEALRGISINVMLLYEPGGEPVKDLGFDLERDEPDDVALPLLTAIRSHYGRLMPRELNDSLQTIVMLPGERPMLYVARHILTSRDEGPSRGFLVMGRYITDAYMEKLIRITENNIRLLPVGDLENVLDAAAYKELAGRDKPDGAELPGCVVLPRDDARIYGYALMNDALGRPAFLLRIEKARGIYQKAMQSLNYMLIYILGAGFLSTVLLLILLEKLLVARLVHICDALAEIAADPDRQALPDPGGKDEVNTVVQHINALLETLTMRRLALQESEVKYRSFTEHFQGIAFRCDLQFNPIFFHGAVEAISGCTEEDLLARNPDWLELVVPEDRDRVRQGIEECMRSRFYSADRQYRIRRPDGTIRWVHEFIQNVASPGENAPRFIQGAMYDITAMKTAEMELSLARQQMAHLARHLQDVREIEKTRLARQVHDELGQLLMALKMDLKWLEKRAETIRVPSERLESMMSTLQEVEASVRRIALDLKPGVLDSLGLQDALEWLIDNFAREHEIACRYEIDLQGVHPDKRTATIVFRILQEGLVNIFRHSQADHVSLNVSATPRRLFLRLADNGVGVPPDILNSFTSFGLIQMRERADSLGGSLILTSPPEGGFVIELDVPLETEPHAEVGDFTKGGGAA